MARYLFDNFDNGKRVADEQGFTFDDRDAVRRAPVGTRPHMAFDALPDGATHDFVAELRDHGGERVFRATHSFRSECLDPTSRENRC